MIWEELRRLRAELKRPLIMAHRGASAILPENTLTAFQRAIADGADVLETDLHFTRDDEIVLIHDDTLDRTVEAMGLIRDFTLSEIKQFKIRQPPSRKNGIERVPTLKELIELTEAKMPLVLELKDALFEQPQYGQKLVSILGETGLLDHCAVISFDMHKVKLVEGLVPELVGGWITLSNLLPTQPVELLGPFWPLLIANPFYVAWAHRLGKFVGPLDPNPEARLGLYLKLGVDIILTDNPGLTLKEIDRRR
jgi:glycerophosphoryl diester phosphodiesterase